MYRSTYVYDVQGSKANKLDWRNEIFTKTNCNLCMEERLTTLKKLRDKHVTITNTNSEIYEACQHKTTFH